MSKVSAIPLLLRRDRSDLVAVVLVTLLVGFTAFIAAGGFRLFERTADDALQRAVAAAPVGQRTIRLGDTRLPTDPNAIGTVADWHVEGEQQRSGFPEPLRRLVGDGNLAIGSVRFRVGNPPAYPLYVALRYQDGFPQAAELVSGRWPAATGEQLPPVADFPTAGSGGPGRPVGTSHESDEPRRFEIALQESTARALGITVGAVYSVAVDLLDPQFTGSVLRTVDVMLAPTELEVTGLYRAPDRESDVWFGDPRLASDDLGVSSDVPIASISAYVSADALPGLMTSGLPFEFQWRFPIQTDRLDARAVAETERGLRIFDSQFGGAQAGGDVTAQAGLLPLFERHTSLRTGSEAVLALAASAPLALAVGAIAMAAVMLSRRRRPAMVLARGRGATSRQMFAASLVESLMVALVACIGGLAVAVVLVPEADVGTSLVAAASIGLVVVVVLVGATWPQIRQPLADLEGSARRVRRADARRLVLELIVVVLAVIGAYLLRQRGIATAGSPARDGTDTAVGFDPFLAAVPALIALAVGIVALRLYRPAMAFAGWMADHRRDLVPVLGVRTIARGAASGMPVLVLLLAVAFAAFMSVVSNSVEQAQQEASWYAIGADLRIEPTGVQRYLPTVNQVGAIQGVTATASGFIDPRARAPANSGVGTFTLYAVDPDAYADVVADSPIEPRWPLEFLNMPVDESPGGPVPVIMSGRMTGGQLRLGQGDVFSVILRGRGVQMEIVEIRTGLPGLVSDDAFAIMPYAALRQAVGGDLPPSVMWIRAAPEASAAVHELIDPDVTEIRLLSRYEEYSELRDQPLVGAVGAGFVLALAVSIVYAVLTIIGAVMLSAARSTRDVAILRTLGLAGRQQTRLSIVEHAPPILIALPIGLALGIGVAFAVAPALGLGTLSGSSGTIPLAIDWVSLALLSALLAAVALAAVLVGTWLSRRAAIINALRITSD